MADSILQTFTARDLVTPALKRMQIQGASTSATLSRVGKVGTTAMSGTAAATGAAAASGAGLRSMLGGVSLGMGAVAVGGLALGKVLYDGVSINTRFQESLSRVRAVSGATAEEMEQLQEEARRLGAITTFTAPEAAEGLTFLSMAGLDATEAMDALEPSLRLAQLASVDLGTSADIASNIMSAFGKKADDLPAIVDSLSFTVANSNTNLLQLAEAMKYLGPNAAAMGIRLNEVAAVIGILGNNGIQASLAGRAFGTALIRLADDTGPASKVIKELGLNFFNANGEMRSMTEVLEEVRRGTAHLTSKERIAAFKQLFGAEAFQEISILTRSLEEYKEMVSGLDSSYGSASLASKQMTDNLSGDLKRLKSAYQEFAVSASSWLDVPYEKPHR